MIGFMTLYDSLVNMCHLTQKAMIWLDDDMLKWQLLWKDLMDRVFFRINYYSIWLCRKHSFILLQNWMVSYYNVQYNSIAVVNF